MKVLILSKTKKTYEITNVSNLSICGKRISFSRVDNDVLTHISDEFITIIENSISKNSRCNVWFDEKTQEMCFAISSSLFYSDKLFNDFIEHNQEAIEEVKKLQSISALI
ncbi:MAG: hypothetical protein J6M05_04625 [Cardiobacteriaceae bacterium]|nr:hypothetical protein [Cardiobacteriaceae bacterium]